MSSATLLSSALSAFLYATAAAADALVPKLAPPEFASFGGANKAQFGYVETCAVFIHSPVEQLRVAVEEPPVSRGIPSGLFVTLPEGFTYYTAARGARLEPFGVDENALIERDFHRVYTVNEVYARPETYSRSEVDTRMNAIKERMLSLYESVIARIDALTAETMVQPAFAHAVKGIVLDISSLRGPGER